MPNRISAERPRRDERGGRDERMGRDERPSRYNESRQDDARGPRPRRDESDEGEAGARRKSLRPPQAGMQRYRIEVGWQDGVRPGNIVGAVANEAGISGSEIGPIDIRGNFSTIDLPADMPPAALDTLKRTWVSGKQLQIRPFSEGGPRSEASGDYRGARAARPAGPRAAGKPFGRKPTPGFKAAHPKAAGKGLKRRPKKG